MERSTDWLRQAKRDLEKAQLDLEHGFYEWACFTAQQASEKAVKALYYSMNMEVRGRSLYKLLKTLSEMKGIEVDEELLHYARVLDRYYIEARYPNGFPEGYPAEFFDLKMAQEAVDAGRKILRFCEGLMGG
ncbi:MAG: HEPN domain-containing protein [Aquificae bacterium]|nr:HEPN domain-containing protein [Aquificota bacterium]